MPRRYRRVASVTPQHTATSYAELLPGEAFLVTAVKASRPSSDEDLNSRYAKGDIRIVTESARYPLAGILSMLREIVPNETTRLGVEDHERRYKLDPEYQRRHRWSNQRKSRLIESFLMNIPVPPVFLYERELARFEVMDGRQRLSALADFYGNRFALEGLEYWPELDGRFYSQLPSKVRDGIDRRYISSIILLKETAIDEEQASFLKKIVFERLNSGGVKLSPQETRNAVFGGPLNELCIDLSSNETFRAMWGIPSTISEISTDEEEIDDGQDDTVSSSSQSGKRMFEKMEDVELVLRFFAYRHIQQSRFGLNRISEFLDSFLKAGNNFSVETLLGYRRIFTQTIDFLFQCLGTDAFAAFSSDRHYRPTKIVFDPIMAVASAPEIILMRAQILEKKHDLRTALAEMYSADRNSQYPSFSGRRTNNADIGTRNRRMHDVFTQVGTTGLGGK